MADDFKKRVPQDASRISLTEEWEVRYWSEALGVSKAVLADAVKAVGNGAAAVREHLKKKK